MYTEYVLVFFLTAFFQDCPGGTPVYLYSISEPRITLQAH